MCSSHTPSGRRYVINSLRLISLGTVCPYRRRPSLWKNTAVSIASCTSPRDSRSGLPISRVISRESISFCSIRRCATRPMICPRTGAGVAFHPSNALRAARQAPSTVAAEPTGKSPTTSGRYAGLSDWNRGSSPGDTNLPPIRWSPTRVFPYRAPFGFSTSFMVPGLSMVVVCLSALEFPRLPPAGQPIPAGIPPPPASRPSPPDENRGGM